MAMRTKVDDSIVEWLSDHCWHEISELAKPTRYPEQWLRALGREPEFEVDVGRRMDPAALENSTRRVTSRA